MFFCRDVKSFEASYILSYNVPPGASYLILPYGTVLVTVLYRTVRISSNPDDVRTCARRSKKKLDGRYRTVRGTVTINVPYKVIRWHQFRHRRATSTVQYLDFGFLAEQ